MEETKIWGPNVVTFELVMGKDRYYVVGGYIPPSDLTSLEHVMNAWDQCPKGCLYMLVGDLDINLDAPRDERDETIVEQADHMDLVCMTRQFKQRQKHRIQGRWTLQLRRRGRFVSSKPNYFLARESYQRKFRNVIIRLPYHHDSNHRAVAAQFYPGPKRQIQAFRKWRHRFQIWLPRNEPPTENEGFCEELRQSCVPPHHQERHVNSWISTHTWKLVDY